MLQFENHGQEYIFLFILAIFINKGHSQGHMVIDPGVIEKCFINRVCMQNMKSLPLRVEKLWPRLYF